MGSLRGSEVDLGHPRGSGKGPWVVPGKGPEGVRGSGGAPRGISGVPEGFLGGVSPLFRVEEGLWGSLGRGLTSAQSGGAWGFLGAGLTSVQGRGAVQVPPHKTRLRLFPDRVVPHPPDPALGGQWWGWDPQNAPKTTPEPPWIPPDTPEYPQSPHPEVSPQPAPITWWGLREFLGPRGFGEPGGI